VLVFFLTMMLGSLNLGDLELSNPRVHLSEGAGNRLVLVRVQPKCPDGFCNRCQDAEAKVTLIVGKSGIVKQITAVRTPDSKLAEAARDAVKRWRYERYLLNGSPVEYETHTTLKWWKCQT